MRADLEMKYRQLEVKLEQVEQELESMRKKHMPARTLDVSFEGVWHRFRLMIVL